jgi:hypothetical protein
MADVVLKRVRETFDANEALPADGFGGLAALAEFHE